MTCYVASTHCFRNDWLVCFVCIWHIGCIHNQQSDESDLLKFIHNQIQICSIASEKNLTSRTDFYKPRQWRMWCKHSSSQFQLANHRDWGINDLRVCITLRKSDKGILFHRTGSISSNKSDRSDCWLWTQPLQPCYCYCCCCCYLAPFQWSSYIGPHSRKNRITDLGSVYSWYFVRGSPSSHSLASRSCLVTNRATNSSSSP